MIEKIRFTVILIMISLFVCNAQPIKPKELLKKVDISLNKIQTVVYKINHFDKNFTSKDTVKRVAICSLYLAPKDEMKAYHILEFENKKFINNKAYYVYRKYDGKKILWNSYKLDSLHFDKKSNIFNIEDEGYSRITGSNIHSLLLKDYFTNKRAFRQNNSLLSKLFIDEIEVTEAQFMNTAVYVLIMKSKNLEKMSNYVDSAVAEYYIRKSDFLPIGYKTFSKLDNMNDYQYCEIDYIAINNNLSIDDFKIDENKPLNAIELYKNFKSKINP